MLICAWIVFIYFVANIVAGLINICIGKKTSDRVTALIGTIIGILTCYVTYGVIF